MNTRHMKEALSKLQNVTLGKMRVSHDAQRQLRPHRVAELTMNFDPETFGNPVVNLRDGHYWIIDGQHRVEAVKEWLGKDWPGQSVTCRVYSGLSETEEAAMYLKLNNQLSVGAFDRFKVAVTAGEPAAVRIKACVTKAGLRIAMNSNEEGTISSVATLGKIFARSDGASLTRTLQIAHQAFGDPGLKAAVVDGIAQVCERYNAKLKEVDLVDIFSNIHGGVGAVLTRAGNYRKTTGNRLAYCVAAALVDVINGKGKKLPSWWKEKE